MIKRKSNVDNYVRNLIETNSKISLFEANIPSEAKKEVELERVIDSKWYPEFECVKGNITKILKVVRNSITHSTVMFSCKSDKGYKSITCVKMKDLPLPKIQGSGDIIAFAMAYSKSTRKNHIDHRINIFPIYENSVRRSGVFLNTLVRGDGCGSWSSVNLVFKDGKFRYLTPEECERCMCWYSGHTKFGINAKGERIEIPALQRYKMIGNGVVSTITPHVVSAFIKEKQLTVVAGMAGVGGLEMMLPSQSYKVVAHIEIDRNCQSVLRARYKNSKILGDIKATDLQEIPDHDLFVAGIPCQSYSILGKRGGLHTDSGLVIYDVIKLLSIKKPKYFIIENVKGLLDHEKHQTFIKILELLCNAGYNVDFKLLASSNFGSVQHRERVFIVGQRK